MRRKSAAAAMAVIVVFCLHVAPGAGRTSAQTQQPVPAAAPAPPVDPKIEQYKRDVGLEVDSMREDIARMNDQVFSFGELGFQEFETSKYLVDILKKNGFTVHEGIAGIPTAFMASWGSGKPAIAMGYEIACIR